MLLGLLLLCTVAQTIGAPAELVLMKDGVSEVTICLCTYLSLSNYTQGAVCLDGSPPGYYLRKGSQTLV